MAFPTIFEQCPKLSMYPAPGVHIFRAGCTIFKGVHLECAHFSAIYHYYILGGCMEKFPGAQSHGECTRRVHDSKV